MSLDAEKSVIGIMLMDPDGSRRVFDTLTARMFEFEELGRVFQCCKRLTQQGERADAVSVVSKLGENIKRLVMECAETAPSIQGLDTYITLVLDGWRERMMLARFAELAISGKDADELTRELRGMLQEQERILRHQRETTAKTFSEGMVDFLAWLQTEDRSIKTGWSKLDWMTGGLARKGVTAVSARPGMGKTTFALQMATQIARRQVVLYQSMEMPREQIYTSIFSRALTIDSAVFRQKSLTPEQWEKVAQVSDALHSSFKLVVDDRDCAGLDVLEANIRTYKPEVVFVDHLGLLTPDRAKQKRNEELAVLTRGLKQMAMKHDITIVELIQASRSAEGKRITMADMFGSASIEHDADMVIGINPRLEEGKQEWTDVDVDILKNRHGAKGTLEFIWRKQYHSFLQVEGT